MKNNKVTRYELRNGVLNAKRPSSKNVKSYVHGTNDFFKKYFLGKENAMSIREGHYFFGHTESGTVLLAVILSRVTTKRPRSRHGYTTFRTDPGKPNPYAQIGMNGFQWHQLEIQYDGYVFVLSKDSLLLVFPSPVKPAKLGGGVSVFDRKLPHHIFVPPKTDYLTDPEHQVLCKVKDWYVDRQHRFNEVDKEVLRALKNFLRVQYVKIELVDEEG